MGSPCWVLVPPKDFFPHPSSTTLSIFIAIVVFCLLTEGCRSQAQYALIAYISMSLASVKSCRVHIYCNVFCLSSLSSSQILAWLANLHQCSDPSSLQLDPAGQEIFSTFCELSHEWYSITILFLRHVDTKAALFRVKSWAQNVLYIIVHPISLL